MERKAVGTGLTTLPARPDARTLKMSLTVTVPPPPNVKVDAPKPTKIQV